jgi:5-methylthioadenosine/S-adenosylhomocysteine deaminase
MEKVDYIIRADYLLAMDDAGSVLDDGAVAVAGSDIRDIGAYEDISCQYSADTVISGKNRVVFPGLINAHTHAAMVYFRGLADDLPLQEWLEKHIWPAEGKWMSAEFVGDAVELACLEMLKSGVTTYADQYFFQNTAAQKLEVIGMRGVLGAGVIDFPFTGYAKSVDDYFTNAENLIKNWKDSDLVFPCIAPHATYTCGPENYKKANALSEKYNVPIHTHLAETQFEVSEIQKHYGKSPVAHMESIGLLSERLFAAHCVWVDDNDIELLSRHNVGVAHCIESNMKLASGFAPVSKMLKAGIRVAFGTDGAASNNDMSILGEITTAAKVHKAIAQDPTALDSRTALLMATRYGAEILGLGEITGSIRKGKKADLVVASLDRPHLTPLYDIYSHIVYCMRPSDIETVVVNGKPVIEKGRLMTMDEDEILAKARKWQHKIQGGKKR